MKFINYLKSISGVDIYPLISLLIFFGFFTLLLIYVVKARKSAIEAAERLPLDDQPYDHE